MGALGLENLIVQALRAQSFEALNYVPNNFKFTTPVFSDGENRISQSSCNETSGTNAQLMASSRLWGIRSVLKIRRLPLEENPGGPCNKDPTTFSYCH